MYCIRKLSEQGSFSVIRPMHQWAHCMGLLVHNNRMAIGISLSSISEGPFGFTSAKEE